MNALNLYARVFVNILRTHEQISTIKAEKSFVLTFHENYFVSLLINFSKHMRVEILMKATQLSEFCTGNN